MSGDHGTCSRCGRTAEKTSSGSPECWACWNYRKLDRPAARHWAKVAAEFLSNVDMYDLMGYLPDCGLTRHEIGVMLGAARKVREHSDALLEPDYLPPPKQKRDDFWKPPPKIMPGARAARIMPGARAAG